MLDEVTSPRRRLPLDVLAKLPPISAGVLANQDEQFTAIEELIGIAVLIEPTANGRDVLEVQRGVGAFRRDVVFVHAEMYLGPIGSLEPPLCGALRRRDLSIADHV